MEIIFYKNQSSNNTINKVLTEPKVVNIKLKNDTDVQRPVLVLLSRTDYLDFNYCYIPLFERFYFVESVQKLSNKLVKVELVTDVLETFKDDILGSLAKFKRKIEKGDYVEGTTERSVLTDVTIHKSDVTIDPKQHNLILSVVGWLQMI